MNVLSDSGWVCDVCKKLRPDEKISVHKSKARLPYYGDIPIDQDVKYCNDDPKCREGVKTFTFFEDAELI